MTATESKPITEPLESRITALFSKPDISARIQNVLLCRSRADTEKAHDAARKAAAARYQAAIDDFIAHTKAEAMAAKKKKRAELKALFLLLMLDAGEEAYRTIYPKLAKLSGANPRLPIKTEAAEFSTARQEFLGQFPDAVLDKLDAAVQQAAHDAQPQAELRQELNKRAAELREGEGRRVAETEAQCCYGSAEIKILKRAGYKTKLWRTMEDDRVRDSHEDCQLQGAIPIGARFTNGLRYPGEVGAPPEEICGCRCWLEGGSK